MFLFLDVVSPIPEFHIINDKKIIDSVKIIQETDKKLSDQIVPTYLKINNAYNLDNNITSLIVTIGPGSYTALRIGASFISGLSQSMNLPISIISIENVYEYLYDINKHIGIYFESSNNQKFFTYKKGLNFCHEKIENKNHIIPKTISNVFFNTKSPNFINKKINYKTFSIKKIVLDNFHMLEFNKNLIIKPIYISNNSILN